MLDILIDEKVEQFLDDLDDNLWILRNRLLGKVYPSKSWNSTI